MWKNYLAAALNNLARNRLYAAISILGLALGMAAAILTGLYIRDELSFDRFIPGSRNVFVVVSTFRPSGRPAMRADLSPAAVAQWLKLDYPEIRLTARLAKEEDGVRHGDIEATEKVGWVDQDFFATLPLPTLAGDASATIHRPDGVVITRAIARKYFGQDAPIGQVLELNHATQLRVGAVLQDLPANSHLVEQIFPSGLNAAAPFRLFDARPVPRGGFNVVVRTYLRFSDPAAAARVDGDMAGFFTRHMELPNGKMLGNFTGAFALVSLPALHLYPLGGTALVDSNAQGNPTTLVSLGLIALLILAVAGINFVNLMTARAARRAVEVGIRKVAGATKRDLIVQFIGEAVIYALVGLVLALIGAELVLPYLRALLGRPMEFAFWTDPLALFAALGMSVLVGVLAGIYPAFVQSSFRPALVLKGGMPQTMGSELIRSGLATLQFAFLIGLILAVIVIGQQTHFALNEGLRVDKDQVLLMDISQPANFGAAPGPRVPPCRAAFPDQVRALPGVKSAACSGKNALDMDDNETQFNLPGGGTVGVGLASTDYGFLELYGLKPLAGRFYSRSHPGDETPPPPNNLPRAVVINDKAARALGYTKPEDAIGQIVHMQLSAAPVAIPVIGIVPDFSFDMVHGTQRPMVYTLSPSAVNYLSIKLDKDKIPETIRAIDDLWKRTGAARPPNHRFVDDYLQTVYIGTVHEAFLIDALCGVAVFIAALGLLGLAAFTAERRTKEIGIRKAMGASRTDIIRLLLWQFTKPVLWANLIAWPVGWWVLDKWLHGFARHIDLQPLLFLAGTLVALLIAWTTVLAHTVRVAGEKPINALRYE